VTIEWHQPSREEVEAATRLLQQHSEAPLKALTQFAEAEAEADTETLQTQQLQTHLRILCSLLHGLAPLLPNQQQKGEEEEEEVRDGTVPLHSFTPSSAPPLPSSSSSLLLNFRGRVCAVLHTTCQRLLKESPDDVKSLQLLIKVPLPLPLSSSLCMSMPLSLSLCVCLCVCVCVSVSVCERERLT